MDWLAPTLGFLGGLVATGIGMYQWQRTATQRNRARYTTARGVALQQVLDALHELQIVSRRGTISVEELEKQEAGLNELLIRDRAVLTVEDGRYATSYLISLTRIHQLIQDAPKPTRDGWSVTRDEIGGPDFTVLLAEIEKAETYLARELRLAWEKGGQPA